MEEHNKKTPKGLYLLVAFVVAAGIWFFVDLYGNNGGAFSAQQRITGIPIEYNGRQELEERGLMLLEEGTTTEVDLVFEGARLLVVQLNRSKIRLSADLSGITAAGSQTVRYNLSYLNGQGRSTLEVNTKYARVTYSRPESTSTTSSNTATVNISELNRKEVDVRCELVGRVAEGYSAGQVQLSQNTVEIQGLEEKIGAVSYAKVTLDLGAGAEETVSQLLTCQFCSETGEALDTTGIHIKTEQVQATLPVYLTKELELKVDLIDAPGIREENVSVSLHPNRISVSGEAARLRDLDTLTLGELSLLDLVGGGTASRHTYSINVPEGCENLSGVGRATLNVTLVDVVTAQIPVERFQIGTALPEGKTVEILTETLPVTIFGTGEDVRAIRGEDITVTADLTDYLGAGGTYTVPTQISLKTRRDIGTLGEYSLRIRIQDQDAETGEPSETSGTEGRNAEM